MQHFYICSFTLKYTSKSCIISFIPLSCRYFRVHVPFKIMEIVCTDCRVPSLAMHAQRVDFMQTMAVEDYTKLAFNKMTQWFPQFSEGIELSKFMKMIKDCYIFPDFRKPARIGQLEMLFAEEMKTEDAIIEK